MKVFKVMKQLTNSWKSLSKVGDSKSKLKENGMISKTNVLSLYVGKMLKKLNYLVEK